MQQRQQREHHITAGASKIEDVKCQSPSNQAHNNPKRNHLSQSNKRPRKENQEKQYLLIPTLHKIFIPPHQPESNKMMSRVMLFLALLTVSAVTAFVPITRTSLPPTLLHAEASSVDPDEVVARRIIVTGDVQGGYYRSCVQNEGGRFRKLLGSMSPPDDTKEAEIIVEGKRKMVDGFIRWCQKGDVGLNQRAIVTEVTDLEVTGLYDAFYVKTH